MFEPVLDTAELTKQLSTDFGLAVRSLEFLPIGADARSFSYRCLGDGEYYIKLRLPGVSPLPVQASTLMMSAVEGAIRPLVNHRTSEFWMEFAPYQVTVFPFVVGEAGWDYTLSADQWRSVGRCVRSLHDVKVPEAVAQTIPQESFAPFWRERVLEYLNHPVPQASDPSAEALRKLLVAKRQVILGLVERAHTLGQVVKAQSLPLVCCHGDLHSGNFLIARNKIHPVDWDTLSWAPREKDLMFIGGGIGGMLDAEGGAGLFYEGYGEVPVNRDALRYFRCERIVQDVAAYCEELLDTSDGGEARSEMFQQLSRQFDRGGVIDVANNT